MGQVISMIRRSKGIAEKIEYLLNASDFEEGIDFNIVSIIIKTRDNKLMSFGSFVGEKSEKLFNDFDGDFLKQAKKIVKQKGLSDECSDIYKTEINNMHGLDFIKIVEPVDIDLITELGLGVVKHKGNFLIYSPFYKDSVDKVYDLMLLSIYFQLKHPLIIDENLKRLMSQKKYRELVEHYIIVNRDEHMKRLNEIISSV